MSDIVTLQEDRNPPDMDSLLSKYGKKKVRLEVPFENAVMGGDGFQIRFRLSKAYRALEKQEHMASKPDIEPYRRRRNSELSKDPLDKTLDEFDQTAHAFLWTDNKAPKPKKTARESIWDMLNLNVEKEGASSKKSKEAKSLADERRRRKLRQEESKTLNATRYLRLLNKSMPLTGMNYERTRDNCNHSYFAGVKNMSIGQNKAMEPFRSKAKANAPRKDDRDPEKKERLKLAREKLKASSKYASFWSKLKEQKNGKPPEEEEKKQRPKMAWCAADNNFMVQEWEQKRKRRQEVRKSAAQKQIEAAKRGFNVVTAYQQKLASAGSADGKVSPSNDRAEKENEDPKEDSPREEQAELVDKEKTDKLFKDILIKKSGKKPLTPSQTKDRPTPRSTSSSEKKADDKSKSGSQSGSQDVEEESETGESYRSYNGFASLLGSSSTSSLGSGPSGTSSLSKTSASSALQLLTRPRSILKTKRREAEAKKAATNKPQFDNQEGSAQAARPEPEIEVIHGEGHQPRRRIVSSTSEPGKGDAAGAGGKAQAANQKRGNQRTSANGKGMRTCKYLYRMCNCQNISRSKTMTRLQSKGKTVGVITVYGCPRAASATLPSPRPPPIPAPRPSTAPTPGDRQIATVCPFCKVFPTQRIRAWLRWNEMAQDFESSEEEDES